MPSLGTLLALGAGVAILAAVAVGLMPHLLKRERAYSDALVESGELRAAWKPLSQPEGVPTVKFGRSYVFITHHKTGTNFMQQLCNNTALLLTGGTDECAYCLRIRNSDENGYLQCYPDPEHPVHGKLRGTFNRFTMVANMQGMELKWLRKYAPDYRAIHMVREPVKITISAYQYAMYLNSDAGKHVRWDTLKDVSTEKSVEDQLRAQARALQGFLRQMQEVHDMSKADNRILELDLETFYSNYNDTVRRVWLHMLENVTEAEMEKWLEVAQAHDKNRWDTKQQHRTATVASSLLVNKSEAQEAWQRLEEAKDEAVMSVRAFIEPMGY